MNKSRCLVRCKAELQPETLCEVINKTKVLSAQQVVKNERGEEVRRLRGLDKTGSPTNWGKPTSSQSTHVSHPFKNQPLTNLVDLEKPQHQYFLKLMFPVVAHTLLFLL